MQHHLERREGSLSVLPGARCTLDVGPLTLLADSHLAIKARDNQPMGQAKIRKDLKPRIVKNKMKARIACLADVRPDGRCIILQDMLQKAFKVLLRPRLRGGSRSLCVSAMIVGAQAPPPGGRVSLS